MGNYPCKIKNGEGIRQWFWSECEVSYCDDGYEEGDGDCIVLSGSCTLRPGVTGANSYVYDSKGTCVVETCDSEYILEGGKCVWIGSTTDGGFASWSASGSTKGSVTGSTKGSVTGSASGSASGSVKGSVKGSASAPSTPTIPGAPPPPKDTSTYTLVGGVWVPKTYF